jgi:hypothetical protein
MNNIKSLISDILFNNFFEILSYFYDNCSIELFRKLNSEFDDRVFTSLYNNTFNFKEM